jgi:hypothetical protein
MHKKHKRERSVPFCAFCAFCGLIFLSQAAFAEVARIEIRHRSDEGTHERLVGQVYFKIDPKLPANRGIADIDLAPVDKNGMVEFSSDLLFFRPKKPRQARGTVFLEVVNRGVDQSLAIMSGAQQSDLSPDAWNLGDGFLLEQGFTAAFLGWQFDVQPTQGLTFHAPSAEVEGVVREAHIQTAAATTAAFRLAYCASAPKQNDAKVTFRTAMDQKTETLSRSLWDFIYNGCAIVLRGDLKPGLYEAVYDAKGSPVAGLGLAAMRDFASYLKHAPETSPLRDGAATEPKVIGYGYSQSARFLREFVRDGFNADERGRIAFDGLMIASAGAGGGSFNHRFAMPGQAGNSVLSILRPVDLPPFTDEALLARARGAGVAPNIFYTFSSTEYWARAGSLTHTTEDGSKDVPLAPTSRLYLIAGTPHASGPLPPTRGRQQFKQYLNFAQQRWVQRALLLDLDAWVRRGTTPPPSRYPSIASGNLVPLQAVEFPHAPSLPFPSYMPSVWRMDYGSEFNTRRIITNEPPVLGAPYRVLVPQVNADGNDLGGIRSPEIAVPLGTYTGWNVGLPQLPDLQYLSGLTGSFDPFPATRDERLRSGDSRRSIAERYADRDEYVRQLTRAAEDLVRQRFMLQSDIPAAVHRGEEIWDAVAGVKR